MLLIIAISTFVCISLVMLGVYWLLYKPQSATTERLRRLGKDGASVQSGSAGVIPDERPAAEIAQRIANPLNKLLPPSATEATQTAKATYARGISLV